MGGHNLGHNSQSICPSLSDSVLVDNYVVTKANTAGLVTQIMTLFSLLALLSRDRQR